MFPILKILLMLMTIWQHLEYLQIIDAVLQKEDSDEYIEETVPTKL
jgi:hypothetical protein